MNHLTFAITRVARRGYRLCDIDDPTECHWDAVYPTLYHAIGAVIELADDMEATYTIQY